MSQFITGYPRSSTISDFFIQDLGTAGFFGIEFIDTLEDLILANQNLTCRPNILIEGSTIVLDYENCTNQADKDFIEAAFTAMGVGMGFTLSNASYNDQQRNYVADLSASCTFNSYTNYKVLGTLSSIGSTSETNYYLSENFETVPQIGTTAGVTSGVTSNALINFTTSESTSFIYNDFSSGDYVDFSTSSNTGRFVINGITTDDFHRELVTFRPEGVQATPENLKGTEVIVNHSRKVYRNIGETELTDAVVHAVRLIADGGDTFLAIDGVPQQNLVLNRGRMYVFVENFERTPFSSFTFITDPGTTNTSYSGDIGLYSVLDNSLNKRITIFVPNNTTPNTLYYTGSTDRFNGGSISVVGSYSHNSIPPTLTANSGNTLAAAITSYGQSGYS